MNDLYLAASRDIGVKEIPGRRDNARIMEYFKVAGHTWVNSEQTPWCSAAMCAWTSACALPSTGSLRARSWLDVSPARAVKRTEDLALGDIVVLWRGSRDAATGHVALFVTRRAGYLYLLGGNQSNEVCIKRYPEYRFLAGRRFDCPSSPAT